MPSTGPTLVFDGDTEGDEEAGDTSFTHWAAATGQPAEVQAVLPSELTKYRCVALLLDSSLEPAQTEALTSYLHAGGTILAIGEHTEFQGADETMNSLSASVGAGLTLTETEYVYPTVTTRIDPSSFTEGVSEIGYNDASTITVSGAARPLIEIETSEGSFAPLVGEQAISGGTFVMAGDSNMFSDNNGYGEDAIFYEAFSNGRFVRNLCP